MADVYFDHSGRHGFHGIGNSNRSMTVATGIDNDPILLKSCIVYRVYQLPFHIRLEIINGNIREFSFQFLQVTLKRLMAIDIRFPLAEQVQVGTVDDNQVQSSKLTIKSNVVQASPVRDGSMVGSLAT